MRSSWKRLECSCPKKRPIRNMKIGHCSRMPSSMQVRPFGYCLSPTQRPGSLKRMGWRTESSLQAIPISGQCRSSRERQATPFFKDFFRDVKPPKSFGNAVNRVILFDDAAPDLTKKLVVLRGPSICKTTYGQASFLVRLRFIAQAASLFAKSHHGRMPFGVTLS